MPLAYNSIQKFESQIRRHSMPRGSGEADQVCLGCGSVDDHLYRGRMSEVREKDGGRDEEKVLVFSTTDCALDHEVFVCEVEGASNEEKTREK